MTYSPSPRWPVPLLHPPSQLNRIYRFGEFEFSVRAAELRRNGEAVRLQQQPLRVLLVLLEFAGDVVTRDELRERIWPGDSVQDFDNSLRVAVTKLRQALGDDPENPRYVETLPRRGYRFLVPVAVYESAPTPPESESRLVEESDDSGWGAGGIRGLPHVLGKRGGRAGKFLVTAVLLLVVVAAGWLLRRRDDGPIPRVAPLTTYPGLEYMPSISPDGKRVAFAWTGPVETNSFSVYIKTIGEERAQRLVETPADASDGNPVWAPDGNSVYFFRRGGEQSGVYVASFDGKAPRLVVGTSMLGRMRRSRFDVAPDGRSIVFPDAVAGQDTGALFLFDLVTLQRKQITHPPANSEGDGDPAFSHDGELVAFQRNTHELQQMYVWTAAGGERRILPDNFISNDIDGLVWTSDDREILFGGEELRRVNVSGGGKAGVAGVSSVPGPANFPALRGNLLAYVVSAVNANIWGLDLRDATHAAGEPVQLIASTRQQAAPSFSPDGSRIAFQSDRSGSWEIWTCNRDGSEAVQLTHFRGSLVGTPRWSPDGTQIAFDSRAAGPSQIYIVPGEGGEPRRLTVEEFGGEVPSWSRDGKWIYYSSVRDSRANVWKVAIEGGRPQPVTEGSGIYAVESFDGGYVYFSRSPHDPAIWRVPVKGGAEEPVSGVPKPFDTSHWAIVATGIYIVDGNADLLYYQFDRRSVSKVYHDSRFLTDWSMAVSPDGRRVLWAQIDHRTADLMLVENFR